jgi:predicted transcriptional regulator
MLREGGIRLTEIAKRISVTPQEASRHVTRLSRSALIEKGPSGTYRLTNLGAMALRLLSAWDLLAARRQYFLAHDPLALPQAFLERIGELSQATYEDALGGVLAHTEAVMADAHDYVWLMADQILSLGFDPLKAIEERGLEFRSIVPSRALAELPAAASGSTAPAWPDRLELGLLDEIKIGIAMNERSAGIVFADANGKLDFNRGFRGADPVFHGWCRDLFEYHWARATRYRPL